MSCEVSCAKIKEESRIIEFKYRLVAFRLQENQTLLDGKPTPIFERKCEFEIKLNSEKEFKFCRAQMENQGSYLLKVDPDSLNAIFMLKIGESL